MMTNFAIKHLPLALALAMAIPTLIVPKTAFAEPTEQVDNKIALDITAGNLSTALNQLAKQASIVIAFNPDLTQGRTVNAINGHFQLEQAIELLLQGSGLEVIKNSQGGYSLQLAQSGLEDDKTILKNMLITGVKEHGYSAPESVSATRGYVPLLDTPRSVQIVSQQFIQDLNIERLEDALMYIPGVERANDLGQLEHAVTIRGFSSDGMVFRNSKRQNYGGQIDKHTVERIEVLKGPASVQFGANSPGGIVNVVTKKPQQESEKSIKLSLDEYGKRELVTDMTGKLGSREDILYRLIASAENSDTHRDFDEVEATTFAPSLRFLISDDTIFDLSYQYQNSKRGINQGLPQENFTELSQIPTDMASRNFGEPGDDGEYTNHLLNLELQKQLSNNWKVEASYVYVDQDLSTRSTSGWPYFPTDSIDEEGNPVVAGTLYRETFGYPDKNSQSHQLSALLHGDFMTGNVNHLMTIGIDFSKSESEGDFGWAVTHDSDYGSPFNIYHPRYGLYNEPIEIQSTDISEAKNLGVFVNDTLYLSEELIFNAGLRYDDVNSNYKEIYTDGSDTYSDNGNESDISWHTGLLYKQRPELSYYLSYAQSFEPNYVSPDVGEHKNSQGEQWEVGIKGNISNDLLYSLVYYDLRKTNIPKDLPDNTTRLVGEQYSKGLELDISYDLSDQWKLMASYAYTNATYSKDAESPELEGNNIPGVSPHAFALFSHYSLDHYQPGLSVFGGIKYKGSAPFNDANDFNTKAFSNIDLGLQYRFKMAQDSEVKIQAGIKNLTDEAGIWTDTWSVNYSRPRTFYLTADYLF